ncbi:LD-carboxypeptidase [Halobacillus litoralis]|uniref:LD-carboxypeptidase n=1 Tax=Halobacillus litoralis TaxID=45668 RepID=A0A845DQ92_9BACI|nr:MULTISPECIES: LD-carboxypeptidase [Halobacillus]MYL18725.1 LD-carboxypeptidase [Halobacillus litoralis]MYL31531.1 LD-carboxypeptidase [Halobacillus halophilus]
MIKPNALRAGDRVTVVAPAGKPDHEHLKQGIKVLENIGLEVTIGPHVFSDEEGTEAVEQQVKDLYEAFADPSVRGVFCATGGFGSAKIASLLDYEGIKKNPKIFWGYSDITYLLNAIQKNSRLVTFHGPMVASDLNDEQRAEQTESSLSMPFIEKTMVFSDRHSSLEVLAEGEGRGHLAGGNLTLLTNGLGTPHQVDADGAVLLIEEVGEPAFLIDLKLTHLKQAGVFDSIRGVVLGNFQVEADEEEKVSKVLRDFFAYASFPVVKNFPFGHRQPNYGVPLGVNVKLTTSPPQLVVDSGVSG